jgi:hypothetical protein
MSSSTRPTIRPATTVDVRVTEDRLHLVLADGREISTPLDEFPRLRHATQEQRDHWEITDFGLAVRWPDIDEDIGLAGVLGVPETLLEEAAGYTIHSREPSNDGRGKTA